MKPQMLRLSFSGIALFLLVTTFLVLSPASPANRQSISRDSGVFLYTGWQIREGKTPYSEAWDHKTPGIFYIDALGLAIDDGSLWGVWALEFLSLFISVFIAFYILKNLFGLPSAFLSSLIWLFALAQVLAGGNLTEEYALPFQFSLLLIFYKTHEQRNWKKVTFWLGVMTAAAFLVRQNAVGLSMAILIWLVIQYWRSGELREFGKLLLRFSAGLLALLLPVLGYFAWQDALLEFWDAAIVFNFLYVGERDWGDRLSVLKDGFSYLAPSGIIFLALWAWTFTVSAWLKNEGKKKGHDNTDLWQLLALALPIEIALVAMGGRPRAPYFISLLPILCLLSGLAISKMQHWLQNRLSATKAKAIIGSTIALFCIIQANSYLGIVQANRQLEKPEDVLSFIAERSLPTDTVLLIGAEASINFEARRASPTRFVYQYPLFRQDYAEPEKLEEFFLAVLENKPKLIIVTLDGGEIPNRFGASKTGLSEQLAFEISQLYIRVAEFENGWVGYEYQGP